MKKILIMLLFVCMTFSVYSQADNSVLRDKKKDKYIQNYNDRNRKGIENTRKSTVIPSYRSKKHLNNLKGKYYTPVMNSNASALCETSGYSSHHFSKIFFFDVNYALSSGPQNSYGVTLGSMKRFGFYVSAMMNFNYIAFNTDIECDRNGYVNGEMQYYSGNTTNSRFSVIAGLMYSLSSTCAIKIGAGYGARANAWETADGKYWIRNIQNSYNGVEFSSGLQIFANKFNISVDVISNDLETVEIKIGIGCNIIKR